MLNLIKKLFTSGYNNNPKAIIIACYFNPPNIFINYEKKLNFHCQYKQS